jgi:cytochrome bd ubiquinol oxidase subunit I
VVTGAFFVVGISAYHVIRKTSDQDFFQRSMRIGLIAALLGCITVVIMGDLQAKQLVRSQPMKTAAAEALWDSEDPAALSLMSIVDQQHRRNVFAIRVPYALSFLAYDSPSGEVKGINQLEAQYVKQYGPGDYIPSVVVTFWGFRLMVGAGLIMAFISLIGLFFLVRKRLEQRRWFLWVLVASIAFPYVANTSGWILTEMGRQPWLVFGLLKTADGVSSAVSSSMVLFSLIVFVLLYGALAVVDGALLFKYAKLGVPGAEENAASQDEQLIMTY